MEYDAETYHVWLLRFWREQASSPDCSAVWRFSVEDVRRRQRHGFDSLEGLMSFLRAQMVDGDEVGLEEDVE